jgi:hypothetical protein
MAGVEVRNFDSPDEVRSPEKTRVAVVKVGSTTVGQAVMQPGWRWSDAIKPIVGTESCQVHHLGVVLAGRMHVVHEDGTESEIAAGDVFEIQPGHDAWVVGDEAYVGVEFDAKTAATFAQA